MGDRAKTLKKGVKQLRRGQVIEKRKVVKGGGELKIKVCVKIGDRKKRMASLEKGGGEWGRGACGDQVRRQELTSMMMMRLLEFQLGRVGWRCRVRGTEKDKIVEYGELWAPQDNVFGQYASKRGGNGEKSELAFKGEIKGSNGPDAIDHKKT